MNMYPVYQTYRAERTMSYAEQREADVVAGELAALLTRWPRSLGQLLRKRSGHPRHQRVPVCTGQVSSRTA